MPITSINPAAAKFAGQTTKTQQAQQPQFAGTKADSFSGGKAPNGKLNDFGIGAGIGWIYQHTVGYAGAAVGMLSNMVGHIPLLGGLWNSTGGALIGWGLKLLGIG